MLTLEKHLYDNSDNNDFELLKSIWVLNKKYLKNAQNSITFNFPHYSLHESSHSNTIIRNIEAFLGQERISQLSPTDTWLILMAAHTHDLGMIIFNNTLEKKWQEDEFQNYLNRLSKESPDKDLREAAQLIFKLNSSDSKEFSTNLTISIQIRKAVILVTADFFRVNHHIRSKEIILGEDEEFNKYINGFSLTGIPNRFVVLLSEIAYGHGIDFSKVFDRLEFKADGFGGDKMHPRFVAYLLRLGDLLDVDDKRFSIFSEKVFADSLPHSSKIHKEKHASVKHLLISPTSIEVTVDCMSDEVYRVARGWFDWLQNEVSDQSKEWANIAPNNLSGLPPTITRQGIKILYKSSTPKKDLMNLRFEISNKKVFEMFEGSAIYEYAGVVFIREIVQNAIDASKIQIWKLVESGYYDNIIRQELNLSWDLTHEDVIKNVQFFFDLPLAIWSNFLIDMHINWDGKILTFSIQDNGTGISEDDLIRMTKKVGESRSSDDSFQKLKKHMPFWLKPTGAFGIGLQSLFLVSNSFTIQTKSEYEEPKEIQFYSAKNGEYCRITPNDISMRRGTKLELSIDASNFNNIFENRFPVHLIDSYDWFDDEYKSIYLHKIVAYILEEFEYVDLLNVYVNKKQIKKAFFTESDYLTVQKSVITNRGIDIVSYLYPKDDKRLFNIFRVFENLGIGSDFTLSFFTSMIENDRNRHRSSGQLNKQLVRDIPVEESFIGYYKTSYLNIIWNFESPESDKILNISRSKFIKKEKKRFDKIFLDNVLPKSIKLIIKLFQDNVQPGDEKTAIEFFHLHLTALMNECEVTRFDKFYQKFLIPKSFITNPDLSETKFIKFFEAKRILSIDIDYFDQLNNNVSENFRTFQELNEEHIYNVDMIFWDIDYFIPYLKVRSFHKVEYYEYVTSEKRISISIFELNKSNSPLLCNEASFRKVLLTSFENSDNSKRRDYYPPLEKYWEQISVNKPFDEFMFFDYQTDSYIISPFRNTTELKEIIKSIKQDELKSTTFDENNYVRTNYLSKLIPDSLIDFVISNTSHPQANRSYETVLDSYQTFIMDVILINKPLVE